MPYFDFGFDVYDERLERFIYRDFEVVVEASDDMGAWTVEAVFLGELDKFGRLSKDAVELSNGDAHSRRLWADAQAAAQKSIDTHGSLWWAIQGFLEGCDDAEQDAREHAAEARAEYYAEMRSRY